MSLKEFRHWLSQRFQYNGAKKLKQNDILVFVYKQGFLYLVLILITFIAGINYANNLILGFCFLISAVLCISFYITFKQLHELSVEIVTPEVGRKGKYLNVKVLFKQRKISPRYLQVKIADQIQYVLIDQTAQSIELHVSSDQRGCFILPEIQIFSTYPLGLVRAWTYCYSQNEIWIAPEAVEFKREHQIAKSSGQPDLEEFRELRIFREGDSLQAVSWKQAARGQGLYIKQFEDQQDSNIIDIDYEKIPALSHEEKLSLMMGLVDQCELEQMQYSLRLPNHELVVGFGEKQLLQAQLLLAKA